MSDYFGALMRSSAAPGRVDKSPSRDATAPTTLDQRSTDPWTFNSSNDIVELNIEREPVQEMSERAEFFNVSPAVDQDPSTARAPQDDASLRGETVTEDFTKEDQAGVIHLRRGAMNAALKWIVADPGIGSPAAHADTGAGPQRSVEGSNMLPHREVSVSTVADVPPAQRFSSDHGQRAVSVQALDDVRSDHARSMESPASKKGPQSNASAAIEDMVEVSIGAIHVHVDGSPSKGAEKRSAPRQDGASPGHSPRSGLERRYLPSLGH